jgi:Flp pilus assembly pilin Flp
MLIVRLVKGDLMSILKRLLREEDGQDLTEYTLLLAFIALTTAALVVGPMSSVNQIWVDGNSELSLAASTATS